MIEWLFNWMNETTPLFVPLWWLVVLGLVGVGTFVVSALTYIIKGRSNRGEIDG